MSYKNIRFNIGIGVDYLLKEPSLPVMQQAHHPQQCSSEELGGLVLCPQELLVLEQLWQAGEAVLPIQLLLVLQALLPIHPTITEIFHLIFNGRSV